MSTLPDRAVCLTCGYRLRGLPNHICPECGRAFDPADRRTYRDLADKTLATRLAQRWSSPPPSWHAGLTIALTLAVVTWMSSSLWPFLPTYDSDAFLEYSIPVVIFAMPLLLTLVTSYLLRYWACRRFGPPGGRRRPWTVLPICLFMVGTACIYPWPTVVAVVAGRPSLGRAATAMRPGQVETRGGYVGLTWVERKVCEEPGRVKFVLDRPFDLYYDVRKVRESPHYFMSVGANWFLWVDVPSYAR